MRMQLACDAAALPLVLGAAAGAAASSASIAAKASILSLVWQFNNDPKSTCDGRTALTELYLGYCAPYEVLSIVCLHTTRSSRKLASSSEQPDADTRLLFQSWS